MTKEIFEKAQDLYHDIENCQNKIDSYSNALKEQILETANDELYLDIFNIGSGKSVNVCVSRRLVIDMLNEAIGEYQTTMNKLQTELDVL